MDSSDKHFDFYEMMEYLNFKVLSDLGLAKKQKLDFNNKAKNNKKMSKLFYNLIKTFIIVAKIAPLISVLILLASGPLCLVSSFVIFNNVAENILAIKILGWLGTFLCLSFGFTKPLIEWAITKQSGKITKNTVFFLENIRCFFEQRKIQYEGKVDECAIRIEGIKKILSKLPKAKDCYLCMISRDLQDKTFSEKEVELIYRHLSLHDINLLIYLLYNDKLEAFDKLSYESRKAIEKENNIEELIGNVRDFNATRQQEYERQVASGARKMRRTERFHFYQYDEMNEELNVGSDNIIKKIKAIK